MSAGPGQRAVLRELGRTPMEGLSQHLELEPQSRPEPGPGEVRIRVRAAQVNWVDLLMLSGQYQQVPQVPYTPGMEYCGEVEAVGEGVESITAGARVIADGLLTGPRSLSRYRSYGGFATWTLAPADAVIALPGDLDFAQGCSLLGAYETAYHCLVQRGGLQRGESLLIHGASGSTGLAAVHVAKLLGARVIASGRRLAKLETVRAHGADHLLATQDDRQAVRRFRDEVKGWTDGEGVDVVFDPVGGDTSLESLRCVRFGARFLVVGWASTPFVARGKGRRGAPNANSLPTNLILMKGLDVLGCPAVISAHRDPSMRHARLRRILRWVDEGAIRPLVGQRYPLSAIREAMQAKWRSDHVGATVVEP